MLDATIRSRLIKDGILLSPNAAHWFGTDRLERYLFSRVVAGAKNSPVISLVSAAFACLIGLIAGIMAGYFKGYADKAIVTEINLFLITFPIFFLLLTLVSYMDANIFLLIIVISVAGWMRTAGIIQKRNLFHRKQTVAASGAIFAESALSFLGLEIAPPDMSWGNLLAEGKATINITWCVSFFPGLFIFIIAFALLTLSDCLQKRFNGCETPF
ncbi:MAG: ABC transporter permease [Helicobacteraceae bacterium]|jgi:peptide/nickel transport system permease protein|nr:ABC transporter permease [Helicobacteraceae bacterium]